MPLGAAWRCRLEVHCNFSLDEGEEGAVSPRVRGLVGSVGSRVLSCTAILAHRKGRGEMAYD
jgi:hypothetical protein